MDGMELQGVPGSLDPIDNLRSGLYKLWPIKPLAPDAISEIDRQFYCLVLMRSMYRM